MEKVVCTQLKIFFVLSRFTQLLVASTKNILHASFHSCLRPLKNAFSQRKKWHGKIIFFMVVYNKNGKEMKKKKRRGKHHLLFFLRKMNEMKVGRHVAHFIFFSWEHEHTLHSHILLMQKILCSTLLQTTHNNARESKLEREWKERRKKKFCCCLLSAMLRMKGSFLRVLRRLIIIMNRDRNHHRHHEHHQKVHGKMSCSHHLKGLLLL